MNFFYVAIGAAFGGAMRYWIAGVVQRLSSTTFPYGTLSVNVIGSFILGLLIFYFDAKKILSPEFKLILAVGFCGGFTTFSTFSLETFNLIRDSEYTLALANIGVNVFLTLIALFSAIVIAKYLAGE